jgi:hypothetical protein
MSSDQRWTGGAANRQWQSGTQPVAVPIDSVYLAGQIRQYLMDCYTHRAVLNRKHHPTADGILVMVPYQGDAQKAQVLAAYREAVSGG